MSLKVCKFGGSSVADAAQFRKVLSIVRADPRRRFLVPSAPGKRYAKDQKITDLFYLCHAHAQQEIPFDDLFERIAQRYREIVSELGLKLDLGPHLEGIEQRIAGGATSDYAASRGEYLNGLILAEAADYEFIDAAEVIFFDASGRIDREATAAAIKPLAGRQGGAVIPGFYGQTPDGNVRTFSRGGSDISGAIVAAGVGAAVYENWTDVAGLLMADPRVVESPRKMDTLTYRELRELAYMGANVLHDEAIFPVRQAGIPVNIRNTNDPDNPGTMIVPNDAVPSVRTLRQITGIAGRPDFTVIAVEKALMNSEIGFGRRLLGVFEDHGVSYEHTPSGIDTMSVVVHDDEIEGKLDKVLEDIRAVCHPDAIDVYPNMALVATVGRGMAYTPGTAGRLFSALGQANVNVRMIDQGSSELNIIVGVEADDLPRAVRAIYDAFVTGAGE